MKHSRIILGLIILVTVLLLFASFKADNDDKWGFFAHRRINRMAVFTLPIEMIGFYKEHIEYLTAHAVDPDKRRYATKFEAIRHYIDIDHWGTFPFENVPRNWTATLIKFTDLYLVDQQGDSTLFFSESLIDNAKNKILFKEQGLFGGREIEAAQYRKFFITHILPQYYEEEWLIDTETVAEWLDLPISSDQYTKVIAVDRFSSYGVLPYHLVQMQIRMRDAFEQRSVSRILRLCAEMGHYIGDAHVPLHTTENYNGQLTDQVGIHAFWESRLPELFADEDYDFFVGPANYIDDPQRYYWNIVLDSHQLLDSVLLIEKELSRTFPQDKQYCYDERLDVTIRTQCREYAAAYHQRMSGMVEQRMRDAVLAIGSSWYTAWVDAGQPDLDQLNRHESTSEEQDAMKQLDALFKKGEAKGRSHAESVN